MPHTRIAWRLRCALATTQPSTSGHDSVNGTVDEFGRALVTLTILANQDSEPTNIQTWIDTAFNGELVMPRRIIDWLLITRR